MKNLLKGIHLFPPRVASTPVRFLSLRDFLGNAQSDLASTRMVRSRLAYLPSGSDGNK